MSNKIKTITMQDVTNALEYVNCVSSDNGSHTQKGDEFTIVIYKRKKNNSGVVGSVSHFSRTKLKAIDSLVFLHVNKMHRDITIDELTEYLLDVSGDYL